jgi:hypothetical protein
VRRALKSAKLADYCGLIAATDGEFPRAFVTRRHAK